MSLRDYQFEKLTSVGFDREYDLMCKIIKGIENHPTVDEKEIIHKTAKRIIERLEKESEWSEPTFDDDGFCNDDSWEMVWLDKAIEIVKEECGIND